MKRTPVSLAVAAVLYGSFAMADPVPLPDTALDEVTAGGPDQPLQGSGGAIVGNNSTAVLALTGTLELGGEAQSGANALNLVNSSESTVANGVNVWDGRLPEGAAAGEAGEFEVAQENIVHQEQRRVALLPSYERTGANESSSWAEDSSHFTASGSTSSTERRAVETSASTRNLTSTGEVDTEMAILGQTIQGGKGFAGAGDLDIDFEAGGLTFNASAAAGESALEGEITVELTFPQFSIDLSGAGCAVAIGSCNATGVLAESEDSSSDHTVIETAESTSETQETFVGSGSLDVRSAFALSDAQAEYLVVDDSSLEVEANYGIALGGSAQSNLRALNAVNAAGSAVANAVNISRTPSLSGMSAMSLVQSNIIGHSR
jgi:hypothetical protein